jgi:hypothetical protein
MTGNVFGKRVVPTNDNKPITRQIEDRGAIAAS